MERYSPVLIRLNIGSAPFRLLLIRVAFILLICIAHGVHKRPYEQCVPSSEDVMREGREVEFGADPGNLSRSGYACECEECSG